MKNEFEGSDKSDCGLIDHNLKFDLQVIMLVLAFILVSALAVYFWAQYDRIDSAIPLQTDKVGDLTSPERAYFPNAMSCVAIKGQLNHCTKEAFQKQNEFIKTKRNLVAQEGMWSSSTKLLKLTIFQLWLFVISSAISIYAILLVKKTLDATHQANVNANLAVKAAQEANRIARENSKDVRNLNTLQLQPWLQIGKPKVSLETMLIDHPDKSSLFSINIPIKNEGKTPVNWFSIEISKAIVSIDTPNLDKSTFTAGNARPTGVSTHINAGQKFPPNNSIMMAHSRKKPKLLPDNECWFELEFYVRFKDSFTRPDWHRCLHVKSRRKIDWKADKTITKIDVGQETLEVDGNRFIL